MPCIARLNLACIQFRLANCNLERIHEMTTAFASNQMQPVSSVVSWQGSPDL